MSHLVSLLGLAALSTGLSVSLASGQCKFTEQQKFIAGDSSRGDEFGVFLDVSGDVMVIGSHQNDSPLPNSGSAYVYRRLAHGWVQEQKLTPNTPGQQDAYGIAVSVDGDVIAVGALFDDDAGPDTGSASVYRYDGSQWQLEQLVLASDPALGDRFGRALDLHGDVLAIAGYRTDDRGVDSGSVYLFRYDGTSWVEEQKVFADDAANDDLFGVTVALTDDLLAVGSYRDDATFIDDGSAYVYRYDGTQWNQEQKITPSDPADGDLFGTAVAISGDTLVVGSYEDDDGSDLNVGSAYVYRYDGTQWTQTQKLVASDGSAGDEFGWAVALRGDVIVVGAYEDDEGGDDAGSAYVYRFDGNTWVEERKLIASDVSEADLFASSVGITGTDVWISSAWDDDDGSNSGSVYLFSIAELALEASTTSVSAGDSLTLTTAPGPPGSPAMLVTVDVNGTPVFNRVTTQPFATDCRMTVSGTVPTGLSGLISTFQSFGFTVTGSLASTNAVTVTFQ